MAHTLNVAIPANFWERLLDRIDPHAPPSSEAELTGSVLAGRWLALRRLQLGLPIVAVASRLGVDSDVVTLIEVGLGTPDLLREPVLARLARILSEKEPRETAHVTQIVRLALGQQVAGFAALLEEVQASVLAQTGPFPTELETKPAPVAAIRAEPATKPAPRDAVPRHRDPKIFVLALLDRGVTELFDIWQECKREYGMDELKVAALINALLDVHAIKRTPDSYAAHAVQRYALTEYGRTRLREEGGNGPVLEPVPGGY